MKTLAALSLAAVLLAPLAAQAQFIDLRVSVPLPPTPPLVVVSPGIQVVADFGEEVFFTDGFYWVRRDGRWFRAPRPHAEFVFVESRAVPLGLKGLPPGKYRHYHKAQEKAERRAIKRIEKAERQAGKAERKHGGGKKH